MKHRELLLEPGLWGKGWALRQEVWGCAEAQRAVGRVWSPCGAPVREVVALEGLQGMSQSPGSTAKASAWLAGPWHLVRLAWGGHGWSMGEILG